MQIQKNINSNKPFASKTFKGGNFYTQTGELEKNIILSRAIVDLAGCDVPWIIMANNKHERIERTRRYSIVFLLAFMSPMALVPILNRFAMKNAVGLTKKFWSNNHKAIHLSNEYLANAKKTEEGLLKLIPESGPIEKAYCKIMKKEVPSKINVQELLDSVGGGEEAWEKLRKKIINAKNIVMPIDYILSGFSLGSMGFINNYLTKKKTGQSGFSAEFKMANSNIVEKRADNYEKNKYKRYAEFTTMTLAIALFVPLALKKGLSGSSTNAFNKFVQKHATKFDYEKGIYMSRLAFLLLMVMNHGGLLFASRNKTEFKDNLIRMGMGDVVFFGGDLLLSSLFAGLSDRFFETKLKKDANPKTLFSKIFPKTKPIKDINELVNQGKLPVINKKAATGLYWLNLGVLSLILGFGIPSLINKIIKKDVSKDVEKENASKSGFNSAYFSNSKDENRKIFKEFSKKLR